MNKLTREEALRRWKSAKATKKAMVDKMQKMLYEDYKSPYRRGACEILCLVMKEFATSL